MAISNLFQKFAARFVIKFPALLALHLGVLMLCACAAMEGEQALESQYTPFPSRLEAGTELREPTPWEKMPDEYPKIATPKNTEARNTELTKTANSPYRYRQYQKLSDINKKFGYPEGAAYRRPESVTAIESKMRESAKNEYRDSFNPRDMTTYQQYSRHHWSNRDRRPLDVYGPGRGFPLRPLK